MRKRVGEYRSFKDVDDTCLDLGIRTWTETKTNKTKDEN